MHSRRNPLRGVADPRAQWEMHSNALCACDAGEDTEGETAPPPPSAVTQQEKPLKILKILPVFEVPKKTGNSDVAALLLDSGF